MRPSILRPQRRQKRKPDLIIVNEYALEFDCITIPELQWLFHTGFEFLSPHWMFQLLRLTSGCRTHEMVKCMTLYNLSPDLWRFNYTIDKAGNKVDRDGNMRRTHKHREVIFDSWVRDLFILYLNRHMKIIEVNGRREYVSPFPNQQCFPWEDKIDPVTKRITAKATQIIGSFWWKTKQRMKTANLTSNGKALDPNRKIRDFRKDTEARRFAETRVIRPHIMRHFFLSRLYQRNGKDIIACMTEIGHNDYETTRGYLHTPAQMGSTSEELQNKSWPELLGFDTSQQVIDHATATQQTSLTMY